MSSCLIHKLAPPSKRDPRKVRRDFLLACCLGAIGMPLALWLPTRLCITTTDSLNAHVFYLRRPTKADLAHIQRGDYVRFNHIHPWTHLDATISMLKQVGCGPGDELITNVAGDSFCNGQYLGRVLDEDSGGNRLPAFSYNGTVPEGRLFMVGHHRRSWDSKNYGFVPVEEVTELAVRLF